MSPQNSFRLVLSDQGSNLDSSEPKSDVLPVTPSDSPYRCCDFRTAKLQKIIIKKIFTLILW